MPNRVQHQGYDHRSWCPHLRASTSDGDSANNGAWPCPVHGIFHPDIFRPDIFRPDIFRPDTCPAPDILATGPVYGTDVLPDDYEDTLDIVPDDETRPGPVAFDPWLLCCYCCWCCHCCCCYCRCCCLLECQPPVYLLLSPCSLLDRQLVFALVESVLIFL